MNTMKQIICVIGGIILALVLVVVVLEKNNVFGHAPNKEDTAC